MEAGTWVRTSGGDVPAGRGWGGALKVNPASWLKAIFM